MEENSKRIPVSSLPPRFHGIFNFTHFNRCQSACFNLAFESDDNLVVAAPTGCGKTIIAEIAILRELNKSNRGFGPAALIIYVAPLRALCQEKAKLWVTKFEKLGVSVIELTSDTQVAFPKRIKNHTIICTTPEKLDLATRGIKTLEGRSEIFRQLNLVVFDEIHNLSDSRGAVLEAVVARMLFISDQNQMNNKKIRIICLSATIQNYDDFCQWLRIKHKTRFGDEYRETKIDTRVFGYNLSCSKSSRTNDWMFESSLTPKVTPIIRQFSNNKPVLIFCCTRKSCEKTALKIGLDFKSPPPKIISSNSSIIKDKTLLLALSNGVGIHTAGLCQSDRNLVEQLFLKNEIRFICTTSTLSQGINMPAYLVIIKGTKHFIDGSLEEYEATQILQMQGRAGRPQYEKEGTCIIMTEKENVKKYEKIVHNSNPIESSLLTNLIEHLNAEIALGFITDEEDVMRWIRSTFLYIRIQKNPINYKVSDSRVVTIFLSNLCQKQIKELNENKFIEVIKNDKNTILRSTPIGSICSQFGVLMNTVIKFVQQNISQKAMENTLILLSMADEFANDVIVRQDEKHKLKIMSVQPFLKFSGIFENEEESDRINFYVSEKKVFIMIDTMLSVGKIDDWALSQEYIRIKRTAERLLSCMLQLNIVCTKSFMGSINSALLLKSIKRSMWFDSFDRLAQQIKGIGEVYAKKISSCILQSTNASSSTLSMKHLKELSSYQIEKMTGHRAGWGIPIVEELKKIPEYSISFKKNQSNNSKNKNGDDEIQISIMNISQNDPEIPYHKVDIFIGIEKDDRLIEHFNIKNVVGHMNTTFSFYLPKSFNISDISVYLVDSEFVGVDIKQKLTLDDNNVSNQLNVELDNIKAFENEKYSNEENFENIKFSKYFNHRINSIVGNRRIIALCPELIDNNQEEEEIVWCQNMKEKSTVSKTEIKEEHTSKKTTNDIAENEKLNIDDNFWDTIEFDESDF